MKKLTLLAAIAGLFVATTASAAEETKTMSPAAKEEKMMDCKTLSEGSKERADCEAKMSDAAKKSEAKMMEQKKEEKKN